MASGIEFTRRNMISRARAARSGVYALAKERRDVLDPGGADRGGECGGTVGDSVIRSSNLLVMGVQDYDRFVDHQHSSKTRKALEIIVAGGHMEIIDETDFLKLVLKGE